MSRVTVPYLVEKPGRAGALPRYYWQPKAELRKLGWRAQRVPDDWTAYADPVKLEAAAVAKARILNQALFDQRAAKPTTTRGPAADTLAGVIRAYERSRFFKNLQPSTQRVYRQNMRAIGIWNGKAPVALLTRKMVQDLYETLQPHKPTRANAIIVMLGIILKYAMTQGLVTVNVAAEPGLISPKPKHMIWPRKAVDLFVETADDMGYPSMGDAVALNEWLGQREGDLLKLTRGRYRNGGLVLRQHKTGAGVVLPIDEVPHLVARLTAALQRQGTVLPIDAAKLPIIVDDKTGRQMNERQFGFRFAEIRAKAAERQATFAVDYVTADSDDADPTIKTQDLKFMQLRHTMIVRSGQAGAEISWIRDVSGHTLKSIITILERYMVRTGEGGRQAFKKRMAKEQTK